MIAVSPSTAHPQALDQAPRRRSLLVATLALLSGGILGLAAGFALGIFVYPFWFLTELASEAVPQAEAQTVLAAGEFVHVDPLDPIHWGRGQVRLLEGPDGARLLHLDGDFAVGPGPAFHVYLVDHPEVRSAADFEASVRVDLGRLRAFEGSQNYPLPPDVDPARAQSVVIWCEAFSVLISPATLRPAE